MLVPAALLLSADFSLVITQSKAVTACSWSAHKTLHPQALTTKRRDVGLWRYSCALGKQTQGCSIVCADSLQDVWVCSVDLASVGWLCMHVGLQRLLRCGSGHRSSG